MKLMCSDANQNLCPNGRLAVVVVELVLTALQAVSSASRGVPPARATPGSPDDAAAPVLATPGDLDDTAALATIAAASTAIVAPPARVAVDAALAHAHLKR